MADIVDNYLNLNLNLLNIFSKTFLFQTSYIFLKKIIFSKIWDVSKINFLWKYFFEEKMIILLYFQYNIVFKTYFLQKKVFESNIASKWCSLKDDDERKLLFYIINENINFVYVYKILYKLAALLGFTRRVIWATIRCLLILESNHVIYH